MRSESHTDDLALFGGLLMGFLLEMLPAGDGDCLVLTWGSHGATRHAVIDGGRRSAYGPLKARLAQIADMGGTFELLVLSHVDADHVEGLLQLIGDETLPIAPKRVWYNGYDQMTDVVAFGERQGDQFSEGLSYRGWPLNAEFEDGIACVESGPPEMSIEGLSITMLSPNRGKLASMRSRWHDWREKNGRESGGMLPAPEGMVSYGPRPVPRVLDVEELAKPGLVDREAPNGSSIAFVAEFEGRRVLLGADAHPDLLAASIASLPDKDDGRYRVDLLKVPHHGSRANMTPQLAGLLACSDFAFSTDGSRHGHPDAESIARLLRDGPAGSKRLYFNYRTGRSEPWGDASLRHKWSYDCIWPEEGAPGRVTIEIGRSAASE